MSTPEIGRQFGFSRQALNRHVGILERAGLVRRTMHGRMHELRLVPAPLDEVVEWVAILRRGWEGNLDRLGHVLGRDDA